MTNASTQFSMEIAMDRDPYGAPVIYVDDKNRAGRTYSFGDLAAACDALSDWTQIAQVIVPMDGIWRHVSGFQTELRGRRDRKSEHEKLAQRLARIRAGLPLGARQRYHFEGKDLEAFTLRLEDTRRMSTSALKAALKEEDMTVVAARTKAKVKAKVKAALRAIYREETNEKKAQVVLLATEQGRASVCPEQVISDLRANDELTITEADESEVI